MIKKSIKVIYRQENKLYILDQRLLPFKEDYFIADNFLDIVKAIKDMYLRGAPLIGIAAAEALFQIYLDNIDKDFNFIKDIYLKSIEVLKKSRPTAVDLFNVIDEFLKDFNSIKDKENLYNFLKQFVKLIYDRVDISCHNIAKNGFYFVKERFLKKKLRVLTHCNTGTLATGSIGTALGVIRELFEYYSLFVYVDETRPRLQGALLTAYELYKDNVDFKILSDNTAAFLLSKGLVDLIIVGADRIALNGDTANKIGTLNLAILSKYYSIPFLVAAPLSSIDFSIQSGKDIPIEQRDSSEVIKFHNTKLTNERFDAINYAFDITPSNLITAIITDKKIVYPPYYKEKFLKLL